MFELERGMVVPYFLGFLALMVILIWVATFVLEAIRSKTEDK